MKLTITTFLIVCPLVFLAGLIDAIGGGGGLVSLPAYMLAGLPAHTAVATNKLSSSCGTALATGRFIKNKLVSFKLAVPSVLAAICGSYIGAQLSMSISETILKNILIVVLPVIAFIVMNKRIFKDNENDTITLNKATYVTALVSAFFIGIYDGMYGPGTGTLLIIAFNIFAMMSIKTANAQAKVINLTTNVTSLAVFLINGQVLIPLGLAAAACNMVGGYIGAGLVLKDSSRIVKPTIVIVLVLLLIKIIVEY